MALAWTARTNGTIEGVDSVTLTELGRDVFQVNISWLACNVNISWLACNVDISWLACNAQSDLP